MTKWREGTAAALLAVGLAAGSVQAQVASAMGDEADRASRAVELEDRAREAGKELHTFREASRLYRRAAELRGDQPESVHSLIMAGNLAYYLGSEAQAVTDLKKAGELALAWGDVMTAAQAFLDAAWVAAKDGREQEASELTLRAERLSASPLIQRQERAAILSRIADMQD